MLVVKQPPGSLYARVLVAVDLSPRSEPLIDWAVRFASPTDLKLFHVIDTIETARLRSVRATSEAIQAQRVGSRLQARERLAQLIGHLDGNSNASPGHPLTYDVGNGEPAYTTALHLQATRAELVVVGKRRRSALARFLSGSVALRLARWADSDVLVAPLERMPSLLTPEHCN